MHAFVAPAVVHHRHRKGITKALENGMGVLGGSNQVDVMGPLGDKFEIDFPEPLHRHFDALSHFRYFIVLAVHTGQVAPCKEHRAGAPGAGDAGFLPVVKGSS